MNDIAYNAGLEIRYAIAASGIDPIQHIPEVDAIIERRLAEARRQAFIEAAEIAEKHAAECEEKVKKYRKKGSELSLAVFESAMSEGLSIAATLRKAAEV